MEAKKFMPFIASLLISSLLSAQPAAKPGLEAKPAVAVPSFSLGVAVSKGSNRFDLQIKNPEQKRLQLQIHNSSLGTVVDTVINAVSFSQRYNMELADDGQYFIVVSNGKEKQERRIELKTVMTRNMEVVR